MCSVACAATMNSRRRRSAKESHEQWLAWRKKTVEENFPDVCTCYIYKPLVKQKSCEDCEICPGCEQHIKKEYWSAHEQSCRALEDITCHSKLTAVT